MNEERKKINAIKCRWDSGTKSGVEIARAIEEAFQVGKSSSPLPPQGVNETDNAIEIVRERAQLSEGWIPISIEERQLMKLCVELAESHPTMDAEALARLREILAELAHSQWSGWMKYLFSHTIKTDEEVVIIPFWEVERWKRQMNAQFAELSEREKESDRKEADKFIEAMRRFLSSIHLPSKENVEELAKEVHMRTFYPLIGDMGELLEALVPHLSISELSEITGDSRKTVQATIRLLSVSPLPSDEEMWNNFLSIFKPFSTNLEYARLSSKKSQVIAYFHSLNDK